MDVRRLLLVEFLSTHRFDQDRNGAFPFVQAAVRAAGHEVRWVSHGFEPGAHNAGGFRQELPEASGARLAAVLREFRPTHVLCSEHPGPGLAALLDAGPEPPRRAVAEPDGAWMWDDPLRALLGPDALPPGEGLALHDRFDPDFRSEPLDDLAAAVRPLVQVVVGPACVWSRPVRASEHFRGVDLTGCERLLGCSFCGHGPVELLPRTPPDELAVRQIRAAWRTCPPWRGCGEFLVTGAALAGRLAPFVDGLLAQPLPPSRVCLANRADELLRAAPALEAALPRLAAAGHSLAATTVGAENFSPAENERLNKGLPPELLRAFLAQARDWERRFPQTFSFTREGFSYITFTPWTTLDDLEANVAFARENGLALGRNLTSSRLMLFPDRAITRLAARDGLLADEQGGVREPAFSACLRSLDMRELPWRFRHLSTALVYRVLLHALPPQGREPPRAHEGVDAGSEALDAAVRRFPSVLWKAEELLPRLVRAARARPELRDAAALAEHVRAEAEAEEQAREPARPGAAPQQARPAPPPAAPQAPAADAGPAGRAAQALARALERLAASPGRPLRGFAPVEVRGEADGPGAPRLRVVLERGAERVGVELAAAGTAASPWLSLPRVAATYLAQAPPDTREKALVARLVAELADRLAAAPPGPARRDAAG